MSERTGLFPFAPAGVGLPKFETQKWIRSKARALARPCRRVQPWCTRANISVGAPAPRLVPTVLPSFCTRWDLVRSTWYQLVHKDCTTIAQVLHKCIAQALHLVRANCNFKKNYQNTLKLGRGYRALVGQSLVPGAAPGWCSTWYQRLHNDCTTIAELLVSNLGGGTWGTRDSPRLVHRG